MKHRHVSRETTHQTTQKITRSLYNRTTIFLTRSPFITMPDKRIHLHRAESRSNRPHSIASLSWMESVPYWLKQHERHELLEHVYTNLRLFFTYFPFIKASTLNNNIVSLLDFWLFFFFLTPSYRYTSHSHSLPLSRSFSLAHAFTHHASDIRSFLFLFLFLSLSFSLEKYFVVHDRPVFMHYLIPTFQYNSTILISRVSPN